MATDNIKIAVGELKWYTARVEGVVADFESGKMSAREAGLLIEAAHAGIIGRLDGILTEARTMKQKPKPAPKPEQKPQK